MLSPVRQWVHSYSQVTNPPPSLTGYQSAFLKECQQLLLLLTDRNVNLCALTSPRSAWETMLRVLTLTEHLTFALEDVPSALQIRVCPNRNSFQSVTLRDSLHTDLSDHSVQTLGYVRLFYFLLWKVLHSSSLRVVTSSYFKASECDSLFSISIIMEKRPFSSLLPPKWVFILSAFMSFPCQNMTNATLIKSCLPYFNMTNANFNLLFFIIVLFGEHLEWHHI